MAIPIVVAVCEDDLRRDAAFLKAFAGPAADLRAIPLGGSLDGKALRLLEREVAAIQDAGLSAQAVLVHHDADRSAARRQTRIVELYRGSALSRGGCPLILCIPNPCTERWLATAAGLQHRVRRASPAAGCGPWKAAWTPGKGIDGDRIRAAAAQARARLRGLPDFDAFFAAWQAAGLS